MKTVDTSAKIKCVLEMALKGEISWLMLDSIIAGLTPTLEKSKQIIKALLKEFENHQAMCFMKESDAENEMFEEVIKFDEKQSVNDGVTALQEQNSEEDECQTLDNGKSSEGSMSMKSKDAISEDYESESFNVNDESKSEFEAESEDEEVFDENNFSKNIQLVEAYKGQFYMFVGDEAEEKPKTDTCNKSLNGDKKFHQHRNIEVHSEIPKIIPSEKRFECETCGKCFLKKLFLDTHVRIHTGDKPFLCKTCKKGFAHKGNLKMHERTHTGERPFQCKFCNKVFVNSSNLKIHERTHTGEKSFICETCQK